MAYRPLLSRSAHPATYLVEARNESGELQPIDVPKTSNITRIAACRAARVVIDPIIYLSPSRGSLRAFPGSGSSRQFASLVTCPGFREDRAWMR